MIRHLHTTCSFHHKCLLNAHHPFSPSPHGPPLQQKKRMSQEILSSQTEIKHPLTFVLPSFSIGTRSLVLSGFNFRVAFLKENKQTNSSHKE